MGSDGYESVVWQCKADMDESFKLGTTRVSCEGYDHPTDHYILKGDHYSLLNDF